MRLWGTLRARRRILYMKGPVGRLYQAASDEAPNHPQSPVSRPLCYCLWIWALSSDLLLTNGVWLKWWDITSEIRLQIDTASIFLAVTCLLLWKAAAILWGALWKSISLKTESRLVVSWGWEQGINRLEGSNKGDENVLKLDYGDGTHIGKLIKDH